MTRRPPRRAGYTMLEMVVVMALLVIIGSVVLPTLAGFTGNVKVKGAGDAVKARLMEARLNAMEQGRPYVFSISPDGLKMRVAPDDTVEGEVGADGQEVPTSVTTEELPSDITLKVSPPQDGAGPGTTADGNTLVITFQPDGTCAEDSAVLFVQESGVTGVVVTVRGLTGAVILSKPTAANGGMSQ